jgi:hypothetical protein
LRVQRCASAADSALFAVAKWHRRAPQCDGDWCRTEHDEAKGAARLVLGRGGHHGRIPPKSGGMQGKPRQDVVRAVVWEKAGGTSLEDVRVHRLCERHHSALEEAG